MIQKRHQWLEATYAKYLDRLKKYLRKIVGSEEVAEDLAHDAFLRVLTAPKFDPARHEEGPRYLFTTARNLALTRKKLHRFAKPHIAVEDAEMVDDQMSVEQQAMTADEFELISVAIKGLPEQRRQVLLLRTVFEYTFQEIADHLGISKPTVYREFQRAIQFVHTVRMQNESEEKGRTTEALPSERQLDSGT